MRTRPRRLAILLTLLAVGVAWLAPCLAAAKSGHVAELLAAAERAQRIGKYSFAIQAYKQAHRSDPRAQLMFAIANAHHQRFLVKRAPYDHAQAIIYFNLYLDTDPEGSERERARRALAYLEGFEQSVDEEALARAAAAERGKTRLAVSASVMGATVRIDGGKPRKLPLFSNIKPGKHKLVVNAAGYTKKVQRLIVIKGAIHTVSAELEPEAATLSVETPIGASVHVDGRFAGVAPLEEPIDIEPGTRLLSLTLNGYLPRSEQVNLKRGASYELEADLTMTKQRIGASFLIAAGAAGIATGVVFGVLSIVDARAANEAVDVKEENDLNMRSDDYTVVSGMAAGVGLGLSLSGAVLFVFDEPELSLQPGLGGATLTVRF